MTRRDRYADVGRALRLAIETATAAKPPLNGSDCRVLLAVIHLTASQSKLADRCYNARVAKLAGMGPDVKRVARSLRKLADLGVIDYQPSERHGQRSRYALPSAMPPTVAGGVADE
jgi:hypothetical protein